MADVSRDPDQPGPIGWNRSTCCCGGASRSDRLGPLPRLVAYSLAPDERRRDEHALQFELSITSLRASNPDIPVVLFTHGPLAHEIAGLCSRHGVMVGDQGAYAERLAALSPRGGAAMARYPVLHKHLNFAELAAAGAGQVLCCDLDTIFLGDVDRLFDRCAGAHVVAREEVHSRRSPHGADPAFIDEALLAHVAGHLGRATVPPVNLGVVLYNHGVVAQLAAVMPTFVDDAWRLMTGLTVRGFPNVDAAGRSDLFPWMADVQRRASQDDLARALPYPSNNGWIVEEVAWWLAMGARPGLVHADFDPRDVAQNGEVLGTPREHATWTMCHYYSHNLGRIVEWLRPPPTSVTPTFPIPPRIPTRTPTRHRRPALPAATLVR